MKRSKRRYPSVSSLQLGSILLLSAKPARLPTLDVQNVYGDGRLCRSGQKTNIQGAIAMRYRDTVVHAINIRNPSGSVEKLQHGFNMRMAIHDVTASYLASGVMCSSSQGLLPLQDGIGQLHQRPWGRQSDPACTSGRRMRSFYDGHFSQSLPVTFLGRYSRP